MYNDLTEELVNARKEAVFLTNQYNRSYGEAPEKREENLRKLLGSLGKNPFFEPDFRCEFGFNIHVGDNFYANFDCVMLDGGGIYIGDDVLFGPRVGIYTSRHAYWHEERANVVAAGAPCRVIRQITEAEKTDYLDMLE